MKAAVKGVLDRMSVRRMLRTLAARELTEGEMRCFRSAFGNQGFSGDVDYLLAVMRSLRSGPVLECGTGVTTLLANILGRRHGFTTYSLEQSREWRRYVERYLGVNRTVEIIDAPLFRKADYLWYSAPLALPRHFSLIICDGPAVYGVSEPYLSSWRYGVLPWLKESGRTFDTLLLDDVNEARGAPLLERWEREFGVECEIVGSDKGAYAIITERKAERRVA